MSATGPRWTERKLPGFVSGWRAQWQGPSAENLSPIDYVDEQQGLRFLIAAAWLFCPQTLDYKECVFLAERFDPENVDSWMRKLGGSAGDVEAVVNQTNLYDLFANSDLDSLAVELSQLAFAIGECWQGVLSTRYPDRVITVEVTGDESGSYGPSVTFWSRPRRGGV